MSTFAILLIVYYATAFPTVICALIFAMSEVYKRSGAPIPWFSTLLFTAVPFIGVIIVFFRMLIDAAVHVFNLYAYHDDKESK